MADGFVGNAAKKYFQSVRDVSQTARNMMSSIRKSIPAAPVFEERSGYRTGVGTSENIVVKADVYQDALNQIKQLDERMAERLNNAMKQLDELCNTSFIVPETTSKVQAVLDGVKNSMTAFGDVTTQVTQTAEMYKSQMKSADN